MLDSRILRGFSSNWDSDSRLEMRDARDESDRTIHTSTTGSTSVLVQVPDVQSYLQCTTGKSCGTIVLGVLVLYKIEDSPRSRCMHVYYFICV